ncbi:tetratricopeptide repeat protein [Bacillus massilinigeriensis]|uniref:tetratricopeptide repeat protein n=1 Tax=Bacillus mediterraneensis TaxID=1805474 RepID=UPI0008F8FDA1|nr:tetratricopeptide repeat protein [Bacillus mediterraneensis]
MMVHKMIEHLETGNLEEAQKAFKYVLEMGSDEEQFLLAEELVRFGLLEESQTLLEKLLISYPNEGEILVLLAEIILESGEEERAMLLLEQVRPDDAEYPRALLLMADLYQMEGLYEVSERKLLEAKRLLPNESLLDFALGELYAEQGKHSEAISSYAEILKKQEEIAGSNVYQRIAENLSASGEFEEALPYYEKAMEQKLEINTLFGYAFTALQAGKYNTAIGKFEELRALDPEYHSLYLYLARAYEHEGMDREAFGAVMEGIKADSYNKELYFYGGKLALKLGNESEAERLLREAIALDPEFTQGILLLNRLLIRQERYEEVDELISIAEANEEEEPQLLWDSAIAKSHLEQYSEALNKYRLAYNFFKDNKDFLVDYGYFLIEEGKIAEAGEIFSTLARNDQGNEEYREILQRLTDDV